MLTRLYHTLAKTWIAALGLNLVIVCMILFRALFAQPPAGAPTVIDLQLAFTAERFAAITAEWGPEAVQGYRDALALDMVYPIVYSVALASAIAVLTRRPGADPAPWLRAVIALPFVAALGDYVENLLHWRILAAGGDPSVLLVGLASGAAAIKWALLAIALVVLIVAFGARLRQVRAR